MYVQTGTIRIPFEMLLHLHKPLNDVIEDIKRQAAIRYYTHRVLSLGKAAELAGMSRFEFIDYLRFNREPIFDYTDEEMESMAEHDTAVLQQALPLTRLFRMPPQSSLFSLSSMNGYSNNCSSALLFPAR